MTTTADVTLETLPCIFNNKKKKKNNNNNTHDNTSPVKPKQRRPTLLVLFKATSGVRGPGRTCIY